ncbi:basic membrane protein A [Acetoanaerobium pronyense]|uniref:Basic membrane protein A n=1 Tax=Acetoanaerobium pronyense TaxID=1482736 RepID=A0ABS4KGV8_9FIRM|nr:BMP family ABC transporter substrate-binding protein [Acetoanaerobium pronyense]MBP2027003.1 basic membrane protein A [Acetoanaerobium pronyense]
MKKRLAALLLAAFMGTAVLSGCGTTNETGTGTDTDNGGSPVKVGLVTDSGTIDDKSFNEGTWTGIVQYEEEHPDAVEIDYLQPGGEEHAYYVSAINDLADTDYEIIVTPGFKFETAINEAAATHEDIKFILLDGYPHTGDFEFVSHENVVSVFFNEHEAAFLAGIAAALSTETGNVGFIGGMEIPPVQKFGWGFKAGVHYANENLGTDVNVDDNYVFQGTFTDVSAGQTIASGMYNRGVDIIFHAAGGVGVGVFNEAKQRATAGENVFVIGVDVDQYETGMMEDGRSVTLTSAVKRIDVAAYDYIDAIINGGFPGGEIVTLTLADNGVGIPEENPNLSSEIYQQIQEIRDLVIDGSVVVPASQEDLDAFIQ